MAVHITLVFLISLKRLLLYKEILMNESLFNGKKDSEER